MPSIIHDSTDRKVAAPLLLIVVFVIGIGIIAALRLDRISVSVTLLTEQFAVNRALSKDIVNQVWRARFYANEYVRTRNQLDVDRFYEEFGSLKALLDQADLQFTAPRLVELLKRIKLAVREYEDAFMEVADLIGERQRIEAEVLDFQELVVMTSELAALRMHVISLENVEAFLTFSRAQSELYLMELYVSRYLNAGDEGQAIQVETAYRQAKMAFSDLGALLRDPVQRKNAVEAQEAIEAYYEGVQRIQTGYRRVKHLFSTHLDVLAPRISTISSEIAASLDQDVAAQNTLSHNTIVQTRLVLLITAAIAVLMTLGLSLFIVRHVAERERAEKKLRAYRDHLEQLVAERTTELTAMNEHLRQEISDREAAEDKLKEYSQHLEDMVAERTQELRDAQERLLRREKLTALGQIAGSIGHELRTPLAAISNAVYYLTLVMTAADDTTKEYLGIIDGQVHTAEKIITDLLDFSRVKSLERRESRIDDIVTHVLNTHAPPDTVQLTLDVPVDLPAVFVDRTHVEQVLNNLVINAYQAMPQGGALTIGAHTDEDAIVTVDVSDTGGGILTEHLDTIFEPLFTTKPKGIGLGLAVCKTLIEANGGKIRVESSVDQGSTFTLVLPAFRDNGDTE